MDDTRQEILDIVKKAFSDEDSVRTFLGVETDEEVKAFMESRGLTVTQMDCELIMAVREKSFIEALPVMKSAEEVQAVLKEKGIMLSLDECNLFRMVADKSIMEALATVKNTEEVRNILEERGIRFSPETYSNLEWNLGVDVELSEEELANVAGGWGWKSILGNTLACLGGVVMAVGIFAGAIALGAMGLMATAFVGGLAVAGVVGFVGGIAMIAGGCYLLNQDS